jgi:hypothetical protein
LSTTSVRISLQYGATLKEFDRLLTGKVFDSLAADGIDPNSPAATTLGALAAIKVLSRKKLQGSQPNA